MERPATNEPRGSFAPAGHYTRFPFFFSSSLLSSFFFCWTRNNVITRDSRSRKKKEKTMLVAGWLSTRYLLAMTSIESASRTGYRSLELQLEKGGERDISESIQFYDRLDCPLIQTLFNQCSYLRSRWAHTYCYSGKHRELFKRPCIQVTG